MNPSELPLHRDEIALLYRAGHLLGSTLEPDTVYDSMRELVSGIMDCDGFLVSSYSPETNLIRCAYAWVEGSKLNPETLPPITLAPAGQGMQSEVIHSGQPLRVDDVEERTKTMRTLYHVNADGSVASRPSDKSPMTRSTLMVPILLEKRVLGVVQLMSHRKAAYSDHDLRLLEGVTLQMAAAARNARLYQQAQMEIAERRKTEQLLRDSEERFRQLAENIGAIFYISEELGNGSFGRVTYLSPAFEQVWGFPRQLVLADSSKWFDSVHPDDRERVSAALSTIDPRFDEEFRIIRPDGAIRWIRDRIFPVMDDAGRVYRWAGIAEDVSERKRLEMELHERMEALAEAHRRKDEFLAMLAHELRNPLGPIRNAVFLMKQNGSREPAPLVNMVDRQVNHMSRMIDDLLDMSAITNRKILLRPERLDIVQLVGATLEDLRNDFDTRGLKLGVDIPDRPVWVNGDPTRLSQVVGNLLNNASKFCDPGERVTVRVIPDDQSHAVTICVEDTGIGMEPEVLECVFDTFTQGDRSLDRSRGGLGLGLALVKGFAELHDGTVEAHSEGPGRGARFTVRLPVIEEDVVPIPAPASRTSHRSRRILVIEDNEDAAESLRMLLGLSGHEVQVAHAGRSGIDSARRFHPDIILCDIGLPGGMNGYDVATLVRSDPHLKTTGLIALTGYGQPDDQKRARDAGFDRHLVKPVDPNVLTRLLDAV